MLHLPPGCKPSLTQILKQKAKHASYRADLRARERKAIKVHLGPPNQSQRGIQEAASPSGEQTELQSRTEVDEQEEHQPTSNISPAQCTTCERRCIATSRPWTIFPSATGKIAWMVLSLRFLECIWWCERLLLLPWRNLPSPPQGRNRETTGRRGEKERRQSAGGHSLNVIKATFCFPNTKHLCWIRLKAAREKERKREGGTDVWLLCECLMLVSLCRDGVRQKTKLLSDGFDPP